VAYWAAIKAMLQGWKFYLLVGLWACSLFWVYLQGKESCSEKAYEALTQEIEEVQKEAAKAVKQAGKDQKKLEGAKQTGEKMRDEASKVVSDDVCVPTPERVQLLERVQGETERR
jgi:dsDNA-specific endonuclease/ATPase MutS2